MLNITVKEFLNKVDSSSATPGGGSVSALISAFGAALAKMSILITENSKIYKSYTKEERKKLEEGAMALSTFRAVFERLVNDDIAAFNTYSEACKIEDEKERTKAKNNALLICINVPYTLALTCKEAYITLDNIKDLISKSIVADLMIAVLYLRASYEAAIINVKTNLKWLNDKNMIADLEDFLNQNGQFESEVKAFLTYCEGRL